MSAHASNDPIIGMTLGGCRIDGLLGRGGMGTVYRAQHLALDKTVAVKILAAHLVAEPQFVDRFVREARAAAKIDHPNVVQVLNVAEEEGQHFIIMQFVDGESLDELLQKSRKLDVEKAVTIARQVASGLEALHAQGIVHRDIKPANILLGKDGGVRITDFGLARNLNVQAGQTVTGVFMGTPEYVAPEQVNGPAVDHRADLYSLGVTLYAMLSGELPFEAASAVDMAVQQVTAEPKPLDERVPGLDKRLVEITRRLLRKDPKERFHDAKELVQALGAIAGVPASGGKPPQVSPGIAVRGRIAPPPPPVAPEPSAPVPEISAGPKRRLPDVPGPILPREVPAIPPRAPRPAIPETPPPSPPPPRSEAAPSPPTPKPVLSPPLPARPAPRIAPVRRVGALARNALFLVLVGLGASLLFSVGALGSPYRGNEFWEGLLEPIVHQDDGRLARWGLAAGALAAYVLAFLLSRELIRESVQPGAALMLPVFAALSFYAAGLGASPDAAQGPLPLRALRGILRSLDHPSMLAPAAAWGMIGGLVSGAARGASALSKLWGILLVLISTGTFFAFGADGHTREAAEGLKADPTRAAMAGAAALGAILGALLVFGARGARWRRWGGTLVALAAGGFAAFAGGPQALAGLRPIPEHGASFLFGAFLLYWGGWFLHRK